MPRFLRCTSWMPALVMLVMPLCMQAQATDGPFPIRFSLNAYSFNPLLLAPPGASEKPRMDIPDMIEWCARNGFEAVDITGYYFTGYPETPTDAVVRSVRRKARSVGLSISGTGIRNNFASPDPAVRAADVALAKRWIEVAAKLGAPVIRLFTGAVPKGYEGRWQEVADWMVPCFRECAEYARRFGVRIGIQNHADMLQTADQCLSLLKAIDRDNVGLIVDTGSFTTSDPYEDIERTAPFAVNWQLKEFLNGPGRSRPTDYARMMGILKRSGYKGFVPVETLAVKGEAYDPLDRVPRMLLQLSEARRSVFQ